MQHFSKSNFSGAFQSFTEAIRLSPTSAVYHCNRAAAALQLQKPEIAAEDAENALQRDPGYLRAALRAGRAQLLLQRAEAARQHFEKALALTPNCPAAIKGLEDVKHLADKQHNQEVANDAHASAGARPALLRVAISEEQAALELYSAEQVLASNPNIEAIKCSVVEGLIACRRYSDALARCEELRPGVERYYLEAEALWRSGGVKEAMAKVEKILQISPNLGKCVALQEHLLHVSQKLEQATACMEEGVYLDVLETCASLLAMLEPGACSGLYSIILCQRADASASRGAWKESLTDLDRAVDIEPSNTHALRMRADVHKQSGAYLQCFLDVQRLKRVSPATPGIGALLEDVARLCAESPEDMSRQKRSGSCGPGAERTGPWSDLGPRSAFQTLGVPHGATAAEVRKAYLKLAASWHPDKWSGAPENERAAAEERFKKIQAAYDAVATTK